MSQIEIYLYLNDSDPIKVQMRKKDNGRSTCSGFAADKIMLDGKIKEISKIQNEYGYIKSTSDKNHSGAAGTFLDNYTKYNYSRTGSDYPHTEVKSNLNYSAAITLMQIDPLPVDGEEDVLKSYLIPVLGWPSKKTHQQQFHTVLKCGRSNKRGFILVDDPENKCFYMDWDHTQVVDENEEWSYGFIYDIDYSKLPCYTYNEIYKTINKMKNVMIAKYKKGKGTLFFFTNFHYLIDLDEDLFFEKLRQGFISIEPDGGNDGRGHKIRCSFNILKTMYKKHENNHWESYL